MGGDKNCKHFRVLFICKKRLDEYGISFGLINSARFVSWYLNSIGIESKVIEVEDANCIDREVTHYHATHVIIEAIWVSPEKMNELFKFKRHRERTWVVRIHSKIPFLSNERMAMEWIGKYLELQAALPMVKFFVAPNTQQLTHQLNETYKVRAKHGVITLPNIYFPFSDEEECEHKVSKEHVNIGCFGAIRPLKNQLAQACAAIEFANKLNKTLAFHMTANRIEDKTDAILRNIIAVFEFNPQHKLVLHKWRNHAKFLKLVGQMDLGMQVSFSESFNIVAADFVHMGVPIVVSKDIDWLALNATADCNSQEDMVNTLAANYKHPKLNSAINSFMMARYNNNAKDIWEDFI